MRQKQELAVSLANRAALAEADPAWPDSRDLMDNIPLGGRGRRRTCTCCRKRPRPTLLQQGLSFPSRCAICPPLLSKVLQNSHLILASGVFSVERKDSHSRICYLGKLSFKCEGERLSERNCGNFYCYLASLRFSEFTCWNSFLSRFCQGVPAVVRWNQRRLGSAAGVQVRSPVRTVG